jgi:four helix bundle protein
MDGMTPIRYGAERLRVYDLALDLASQVDGVLGGRVRSRSIGDQLRRAADSVILNIAEGAAHRTPGRKAWHYRIANGSAAECIAALTRLHRRKPSPSLTHARRTANMICVMLAALIRTQEPRP